MNDHRKTGRALQIALIGAGLALGTGIVVAQELKEIAVEAGRATKVVGRNTIGAPIEEVSLTRHVSYADLDLKSHSGVVELERRVRETAKAACKQLDELYPLTAADSPSCTKKAVDAAMSQVHEVVAAAEKSEE